MTTCFSQEVLLAVLGSVIGRSDSYSSPLHGTNLFSTISCASWTLLFVHRNGFCGRTFRRAWKDGRLFLGVTIADFNRLKKIFCVFSSSSRFPCFASFLPLLQYVVYSFSLCGPHSKYFFSRLWILCSICIPRSQFCAKGSRTPRPIEISPNLLPSSCATF